MQKKAILTAVLALTAPLAWSHGAWVAQRLDAPTVVYGHGASDEAYNPEKVTFVQAFDEDGKAVDVKVEKTEQNVRFAKEGFASVALVMDNGYWTKQKDGKWVNQPKNEVKEAESASHSIKTAIGVVGHTHHLPALADLSSLPLVVLPQVEALESHMGDEVEVMVYYQGQPVEGVDIIGDYVGDSETVVAKTNAEGKAKIAVRNQGLNVIAASYKVEPPEAEKAKADKISYTATFAFVNDEHED